MRERATAKGKSQRVLLGRKGESQETRGAWKRQNEGKKKAKQRAG